MAALAGGGTLAQAASRDERLTVAASSWKVVMAFSLSGRCQDRRHLDAVNMKVDIAQIDLSIVRP
jgi:hypothetical protein